MNYYTGWALTDECKARVLKAFPPEFEETRCDHVTFEYGVKNEVPPAPALIVLYGLLRVPHFQIAAVLVNNEIVQPRRARMFHITISRDKGFASGDAGLLLANSVQSVDRVPPMKLTTTPFVRRAF